MQLIHWVFTISFGICELGFATTVSAGPEDGPPPKTFRSIHNRESSGIFQLHERVVAGQLGYLPFFKEHESGRTYELSDKCDDGTEAGRACLKAINECKDGQIVLIKADFCEGKQPSAVVKEFTVLTRETKDTETGHTFTKLEPKDLKLLGILNLAAFGEAWQDPSGTIWGNTARNKDGSARKMNHATAKDYCATIGATLPTIDQFERLASYMGYLPGDPEQSQYKPQVLPDLPPSESVGGEELQYCSSTQTFGNAEQIYQFTSSSGATSRWAASSDFLARCVVSTTPRK